LIEQRYLLVVAMVMIQPYEMGAIGMMIVELIVLSFDMLYNTARYIKNIRKGIGIPITSIM